jgi:diguanylate cyclase (GGDEF)-like protein/putative nucleotidyltransferase with HDIG domain
MFNLNQQATRLEQDKKNIFITFKILILLFCATPIAQALIAINGDGELVSMNFVKALVFFSIVAFVMLFWFVMNYKTKNKRLRATLELIVMVCGGILCYVATGLAQSGYKFVFVLIITIYTMEYGIRIGTILSSVCGILILIGDYFSTIGLSRSSYFQADFMMIATFYLVSYVVGFYVQKDYQLIEHLRESANRDALTGLFNHRYFHQHLQSLVSKPASKPQYLYIADIDFFKVYNDTLGHPKGDCVLKEIANIANDIFADGVVSRYGGEEFAFVISADDANQAREIAERMRMSVFEHYFEGEETMPGHHLTISIGMAERKTSVDTVADWIARADNALYKAKSFRKNRVECYSSIYERFDNLEQITDDERIISIKTLLSVIDTRDHYTYNHTDRVVHYCETFAKYIKLSEEDMRKLLYSAYLHDIGKINISQETLITEKSLNDQQRAEIRRHPHDGAEIVRNIKGFDEIAEILLQHHEKYDGTGYPYGKAGQDLHYLARILTLADSFDAMTSKRPYQRVKSFEEAIEEIRRCKGTHFDPEYAELFVRAIEETYR